MNSSRFLRQNSVICGRVDHCVFFRGIKTGHENKMDSGGGGLRVVFLAHKSSSSYNMTGSG